MLIRALHSEEKIDHLEKRLDVAIGLLEQLTRTTTAHGTTPRLTSRTTLNSAAPNPPEQTLQSSTLPHVPPEQRTVSCTPPTLGPVDGELHHDTDGATVVEGDSSLGAHSAFASNFVNRFITSGSPAAPSLDMRQTLDVLSRIVATLKRPKAASELTYPLSLVPRVPTPKRGQLPPIDKAMALVSAACNGIEIALFLL